LIHAQENLDFYWAVRFFPKKKDHVIRLYQLNWLRRNTANGIRNSDDDVEDEQEDEAEDNVLELPPFSVLEGSDDDADEWAAEFARNRIIEILKEFVVDGAPSQINIHSDTHKTLKAILKDPTFQVQDKSVLDAAFDEVLGILFTDSFPRFVASQEAFGEMVRSVATGNSEQMFGSPMPMGSGSTLGGSYKPSSPMKSLANGLIARPSTPSLTGRKFFSSSSSAQQQQQHPPLNLGNSLDFGSL
jgi:hypothetical protein